MYRHRSFREVSPGDNRKMGGSIEDDSTDDEAIETTANLIAEVAKESQGEATRWVNKKSQKKKPKETEEEEEEEEEEENKGGKGGKSGKGDQESEELKAIRKELDELKNEKAKNQRSKAISDAMENTKFHHSCVISSTSQITLRILMLLLLRSNRISLQMVLYLLIQRVQKQQVRSR